MNSNDERKTRNKSYMQVINLSEKLHSICIAFIVITVIISCVDFILTILKLEDIAYVHFYLYNFEILVTRLFIYIPIIIIEIFLLKITDIINILATTVFQTDK